MRNIIIFLTILIVIIMSIPFVPFSITVRELEQNSYLEVNDTLLIDIPTTDIMNSKITIYIKLSLDDYPLLPEGFSWRTNFYHRVYYTSNPEIVRQIIESMRCIITHGDIATTSSEIIIARNDSTILHSDISIDYTSGIQDGNEFGYCEIIDNNRFKESISKMKPYYSPVLYLK